MDFGYYDVLKLFHWWGNWSDTFFRYLKLRLHFCWWIFKKLLVILTSTSMLVFFFSLVPLNEVVVNFPGGWTHWRCFFIFVGLIISINIIFSRLLFLFMPFITIYLCWKVNYYLCFTILASFPFLILRNFFWVKCRN